MSPSIKSAPPHVGQQRRSFHCNFFFQNREDTCVHKPAGKLVHKLVCKLAENVINKELTKTFLGYGHKDVLFLCDLSCSNDL